MKFLPLASAAGALMLLGACHHNQAAQNVENAYDVQSQAIENQADNLEAASDNTTGAAANSLQNQADALHNRADAVHDAGTNRADAIDRNSH